jgi:YD repeat-containing protein
MQRSTLWRYVRAVAIIGSMSGVFIATWMLAGPLWSGAIFLLRQPSAPRAAEVETREIRPLHKGHVDISTGLYVREDDDFVVDGEVPLVLRRTYLSGDRVARQFGVGTTHSGEWYIRGEIADLTWAELILASGGRIRFDRVTPGKSIGTALFRHAATPTEFFGAYLGWVGWKWAMRFADGRVAIFKACGLAPHDVCSLVEMRHPGRKSIAYVRNRSGRLTAVRSGERAILLEYDAGGRISRGRETSGRTVTYEYDDHGRLHLVTTSDGVVRRYTYTDGDEMLTIDEPGWVIENTFEDGRLVRQITRSRGEDPYTLEFAYTIAENRVTANDVTENDGTHTVYRFSESHYVLSEIFDARGPHPISVTYDRSASTNLAVTMTIRCWTPRGHVVRTVPIPPVFDEDVERSLIATECRDQRPPAPPRQRTDVARLLRRPPATERVRDERRQDRPQRSPTN